MAKSVVAFSLEEFDPTYTRVLIGNVGFRYYEFTNLGTLEVITGDADFRDSQVKDLGNLTTIGGYVDFYKSQIMDLGQLTTIEGNAYFGNSQIEDLGNLTTIGGSAYFRDSQVKNLGNLTTIGGYADFRDSQVKNLGNLTTIGGYADFGDRTDLQAEWEKRSNKDNFKTGGQPLSKTPAPKKDRVYGSKKNKPESSKDTKSAEKIEFNEKTLETIKNKVAEHNQKNPKKKVTLASAKAVVRRGMGAYSSTHRPTISGGKPNSRVAWGLARLNAFFYKIINGKSKSGKYSQDDDLINELGYKVQKYEIGGIFQGTPYDFNAYSTEYIGTGEGNQVFGWGLYFTEIKDIAKNYAKNEMLIQKEISRKSDNSALLWIYTNISDNVVDKLGYLKIKLKEFEELKKEYKKDTWDDKIEAYSTLIDIIQNYQGKIYSVTLFKGKKETDYHLIKWENPLIVDDLVKIFEEAEKIGGIEFKNGWELDEKYGLTNERGNKITGEEMYGWLSKQLGGDKEASLFLLRAGIYGIKYRAGSLSGMEDEEGYNYVIFDANDITIEGKEKYDEILAGKEKFADGGELENEELNKIKEAYDFGSEYFDGKIYGQEYKIRMNKNHPRNSRRNDDQSIHNLSLVNIEYPSAVVFRDNYGKLQYQYDKIFDWEDAKDKIQDFFYEIKDRSEDYANGGLIAPNGKPSNLTPEQYKLVRTKAFKDWFGDWENYPENASKVVDENGEPLVLNHSTRKYTKEDGSYEDYLDLDSWQEDNGNYIFSTPKSSVNPIFLSRKGVYAFYDDVWQIKFFANIKNLFDTDNKNHLKKLQEYTIKTYSKYGDYNEMAEDLYGGGYETFEVDYKIGEKRNKWENSGSIPALISEMGYDAYINNDENVIVVFDRNKLKLADGTNTTFDGSNPDIRFMAGGIVPKTSKDENGNWSGTYSDIKFTLYNLSEGWSFKIKFYSPIMESEKTFFSDEDYEPFRTKKDALNSVIEKIIEINTYNEKFNKKRQSNNPDIRFMAGGNVNDNPTSNTEKLIQEIKKHSNHTISEVMTNADGEKYRFHHWKLKYPSASNWLVQLFEKASKENTGKHYNKNFSYDDISFYYDRPEMKGRPNGSMQMRELEVLKNKFNEGGLIAPNGKPSNLTPEQYKLVRTKAFKDWFGDWENDPANSSKVINKETKEPLVVYHGSRSTVNFAFSEFKIPQEGVFFSSDYTTASWFSSGAYPKLFFEKIEIPKHLSENSDIKDLEKYFKEKLDPTAFTEINEITDIKNGKIFKTGDIYYRLYTDYESVSSPLGRTKELAQKRLYKEILDTIDYKNNQETRPFYHTFLNIRKPFVIDGKGQTFDRTPFEGKEYSAVSVSAEIKKRVKNDGVIIRNTIETTEYDFTKKSDTFIVFKSDQIKLADGTNTTFDGRNPDIRYKTGGLMKRRSRKRNQ